MAWNAKPSGAYAVGSDEWTANIWAFGKRVSGWDIAKKHAQEWRGIAKARAV